MRILLQQTQPLFSAFQGYYYLGTIYEHCNQNKSSTVNEIGGIMTFISLPGFWSGLVCGATCIHKQT